jgi:hypothetical protein
MPFLLCLVLAYMIQKTWLDARTDQELARQGIVSPRLQAKYGGGAKAKTAGYGLRDYLADAWSDMWQNRTAIRRAAVKAAKDVKPSEPGRSRPSWRDRLAAVKAAVVNFGKKLVEPVEYKPRHAPKPVTAVDPAPEPGPKGDPAEPDDVDTSRTCPDCGAKLTAQNGSWWHPDGPHCPRSEPTDKPCPDPTPHTPHVWGNPPTWFRCWGDDKTRNTDEPEARTPAKEKPVTAPTGEAVNYETTVAELEAILAKQRDWLDAAIVAEAHATAAKSAIDGIQQGYRDSATATGNVNDHLQALLPGDGETLAHVGTAGDAMPPNQVDLYYAHLEEIEVEARAQKEAAEAAIAATEAALKRIEDEYGEDTAKVAERMNGNPEFLSSGGGGGSSPAPVSAAA